VSSNKKNGNSGTANNQFRPELEKTGEGLPEPATTERPDLYVLARVIEVLKEGGPAKRTALCTAAGLAYNRFVKYLEWMKEREFVAIDEEGNVHLTARGVDAYDQLVKWILDNVGKLKFPKLG